MAQATAAVMAGDLRSADAIAHEVITFSRAHGDDETLAHALQFAGLAAIFAGELDVADELVAESLQAAQAAGKVWLEGWALEFQAAIALARGDYDDTIRLARHSELVSRTDGDPECVAWALVTVATAHLQRGEPEQAVTPLRRSLDSLRRVGGSWGLSLAVFNCARLSQLTGDHRAAARFLGASEQLRLAARAGVLPSISASFSRCRTDTTRALGGDGWAREWEAGQTEPIEETVRRAGELLSAAARPEDRRKDS